MFDGSRYAVHRLTVAAFLVEVEPGEAFGDYRTIVANGGEWEMSPWSSPDIPPPTVPVRAGQVVDVGDLARITHGPPGRHEARVRALLLEEGAGVMPSCI
jgi:hypothetical protein